MNVAMHEHFMRLALEEAEKGRYTTSPNPMVGAIMVKNKKIISSAYHRRAGSLHAEALALKKAGRLAKGSTLYVNIEPCAHIGRTPPCADSIVRSGIKEVFCAMKDPNPLTNGRGIDKLRKANVRVSVGLLGREAEELNKIFIKYITKKRPYVTLKMAESLDGKIATRKRDSKWITSAKSRDLAHRLRSEVDAVLVGVNTVIKDNPLLTSRRRRTPVKVILDPFLKVPEKARIFSKSYPGLCIVAVLKESLRKSGILDKIRRLSRKGVLVMALRGKKNGRIDLDGLLRELAELEIAHLLVEGGGDTAAGFIEEALVDRVLFFIAPKIIGGRDALTPIEGLGAGKVKDAVALKHIEVKRIDDDILIEGEICLRE